MGRRIAGLAATTLVATATVAVVALAVSPATTTPARPDRWESLRVYDVPGSGPADCLRSAGGAATLALLGPPSVGQAPIDLLRVSAGGVTSIARALPGYLASCPSVSVDALGRGVVAGEALVPPPPRRSSHVVSAVVLGVGFSPRRATVLGANSFGVPPPSIATSLAGDGGSVVAWVQTRASSLVSIDATVRVRVVAVRRSANGSFGNVQALTSWLPASIANADLPIAVAGNGDGRVTVAWTRPASPTSKMPELDTIQVATAAPGKQFGAPQTLAARVLGAQPMVVALAADGDALVAFDGALGNLAVFESMTAGALFKPIGTVGAPGAAFVDPSLAIGDAGAAVIAWRFDENGIAVATRAHAGGRFGHATVLAGLPASPFSSQFTLNAAPADRGAVPGPPYDPDNLGPDVALSGGGRTTVAWARRVSIGGDSVERAYVSTGVVGGTFSDSAPLSSPCRAVNGVALGQRGGEPYVAWTDNVTSVLFEPALPETPESQGRLHIASPVAPELATSRPPTVRLTAGQGQRLYPGQPLMVRATCSAACDLRAFVHSKALASATLDSAGATTLDLSPGIAPLQVAPVHPGPVRVVVHACTPDALSFTTATLAVTAARRPVPPVAAPIDVRAHRRAQAITVTWRTATPARETEFVVYAQRGSSQSALVAYAQRDGDGDRSFQVRLMLPRAVTARFVTVTAIGRYGQPAHPHVTVRIRA